MEIVFVKKLFLQILSPKISKEIQQWLKETRLFDKMRVTCSLG